MSKYSRDGIRGRNKLSGDSPVDLNTGHIIVLPSEMHEVNRGNMYAFSHLLEEVATETSLYVQICVGELPVHLHSMRLWTNAPRAKVNLYIRLQENQVTDGTEELPLKQVNLTTLVEDPEGLKLYSNPTAILVDPDHSQYFGAGGVGAAATSDQLAVDTPLIMSPASRNIIEVVNDDTVARSVSLSGLLHVETR